MANYKDFEKFLDSVSKTYEEYDEYAYTLERSLELSFEELELLRLKQKSSYEAQLKAIVNAMPDIIFLNNEEGIFLDVFSRKDDDFYVSRSEIIGKSYREIFPLKLANFFNKNLNKTIKTNQLNVIEYELTIHNEIQYFEARLIATGHLVDDKQTVISIIRNISKERKAQLKLEYLATHDDLTKLPNRFYFQKRLKAKIKEAKKEGIGGALFFLDIDHFKTINDNLGHDVGDKILLKIIKRLKAVLSKEDFLARFGGDEFVIIVHNRSESELKELANAIMKQFLKPFKVKKYFLELTTSIGICGFNQEARSTTQLLKQVDIAMYRAKDLGRNRYVFFTDSLAEKAYREFNMEVKLKKAIERDEFYLVYQPQISLLNQQVVGVEALIRWKSDGVLVPPLTFIALAERCGYIEHISNWVINEVCRQINLWKSEGYAVKRVAINLSRHELSRRTLLTRIVRIINRYKVDPSSIEFEVTETALFRNTIIAFENIKALRQEGFLVSIDDFGTGYSSLSNLNDSLFDKLKIDRSFIVGINKKKESEHIIKATIAIAKSLNLKVLAEGVETKEQLNFLKEYHCDEVQGYYFSPPILPEQLLSF